MSSHDTNLKRAGPARLAHPAAACYTLNMIDFRVPLWLLVAAALIVGLPLLIRLRRDLKLTLAFRALVESDRPAFLIYNER